MAVKTRRLRFRRIRKGTPLLGARSGSSRSRRARRKRRFRLSTRTKAAASRKKAYVPPPFGYSLTTEEWTQSQTPRPFYQHIYASQTYPLKPPRSVDGYVHREFTSPQLTTLPSFVSVIPEGRIWGASGAVISADNKLLWDVTDDYLDSPRKHPVFQEARLDPVLYTTEPVGVLTYRDSGNYFHWMYDVLPRLELYRHSPIPIQRYVVNSIPRPFQLETLNALGIRNEQLIQAHPHMHLQVKHLVVGSWSGRSVFPKWPCEFLRRHFLPQQFQTPKGERIYVSRATAPFRKVSNEDEIMQILARFGFQHVVMDSMPVTEQAKLFASADAIVAAHGAALCNLVFCHPGTKVIELFSHMYVSPLYWIFSQYMDLSYYYLFGADSGNLNVWINPALLADTLRLAGM
ncbi:glycosyltransferase family 61 protein [Paenibacillus cremeus]|uniref:Glycosyltransferase family 61 protein n=1 Tax=Paenibacillus cremeus TaxID=2163881 RepID=A0A559KI74_9BACL|nr:glycosyltransferase family 61 protein [Paenibacillus cremeus]TVY11835.1 glycosyltransferase family 61 protein [Paenibacillus cremeus]